MKCAAVIPAFLLCACASPDPDVAATVNGKAIPMESLRVAVVQVRPAADADFDPSGVLEQMIERELIVQKARRLGFDRLPEVAGAIATAQADLLIRVYLESRVEQTLPANDEPMLNRQYAEAAKREARALRRGAAVEYFVEFGCRPETAADAGTDSGRPSFHGA